MRRGDPSKLPPVGWALHMLIPFNPSCCPSEFTVGLVPEAAAHTLPGSSLPQGLTAPHSVTHSGSVQIPRLSVLQKKTGIPQGHFFFAPVTSVMRAHISLSSPRLQEEWEPNQGSSLLPHHFCLSVFRSLYSRRPCSHLPASC